jgi:penicillin-binding protein 1A
MGKEALHPTRLSPARRRPQVLSELRLRLLPVSALTTAQVAFLVGLSQNTSRLNPVSHPDRAAERRLYILKSLAGAGVISDAEAAKAASENAESTVVPKTAACP